MRIKTVLLLPSLILAAGCSGGDDSATKTDADYQREVASGVHATLLSDVEALHAAAVDLAAAAPAPADRGWDADADADAIEAMTAAWLRARAAYERTEGALAPLFPDIDAAIDARYEDFLEGIGPDGDTNLFDGEGVTGMHAIERILFAGQISAEVVTLEASLPGYQPAAWPANADDAAAFKSDLCARLADDTGELRRQWRPQSIDLGGAFGGLISLMNEQREKINKAASQEEESRYAQRTMADIRDNLAGTRRAYAVFKPWLASKSGGAAIDAGVEAAFSALDDAYGQVSGDAIPQPPASWSSETPSAADLETPFGRLYQAVQDAVDPNREGSAVDGMNRAARELGFPEFAQE